MASDNFTLVFDKCVKKINCNFKLKHYIYKVFFSSFFILLFYFLFIYLFFMCRRVFSDLWPSFSNYLLCMHQQCNEVSTPCPMAQLVPPLIPVQCQIGLLVTFMHVQQCWSEFDKYFQGKKKYIYIFTFLKKNISINRQTRQKKIFQSITNISFVLKTSILAKLKIL